MYVLIDALGWEILRDRPFLDDLLPERHRVETVLGYSCGAIPTVLTGALPSRHGFWNYYYRSPETSPFWWTRPLRYLPKRFREWRGTRRIIQMISKVLAGYGGYFSVGNLPVDRMAYFDLSEKSQIYEPGALAPTRSIFDELETNGTAYECYNYHAHSDEEILALMPSRLRESDARVYFLYLSGLDAYFHYHIDDADGVSEQLAFYEQGLRAIDDAARERWGKVRWSIFSDHGMTPIRQTVDLIGEVERLGLRVPEDYLATYDSTMARFWTENEDATVDLRGLLDGLRYGRVLTRDELAELGVLFDDDRYGELVFLVEPGTIICPSDLGRVPTAGMHGFHPREDPCSYAVYLSSHAPDTAMQHITDIFPNLKAGLFPT